MNMFDDFFIYYVNGNKNNKNNWFIPDSKKKYQIRICCKPEWYNWHIYGDEICICSKKKYGRCPLCTRDIHRIGYYFVKVMVMVPKYEPDVIDLDDYVWSSKLWLINRKIMKTLIRCVNKYGKTKNMMDIEFTISFFGSLIGYKELGDNSINRVWMKMKPREHLMKMCADFKPNVLSPYMLLVQFNFTSSKYERMNE